MTPYVTVDLLRDHLGDRMTDADLSPKGDLTWSDQELYSCMEAAARSYNSLPPHIGRITDANKLDAHTDMFLDAAAAAALERKARTKAVNRVTFTAGNIETDPDGVIFEGMMALSRQLRDKFTQEARMYKATLNMRSFCGRVG